MIDGNVLIDEVIESISSGSVVRYVYKCVFITEEGEVEPLSLTDIEVHRTCSTTWYDKIGIKVVMGSGSFNKLAKFRDNLLVRITKHPMTETDLTLESVNTVTRLTRAVLGESSTNFLPGEYTGRDDDDSDLTRSVTITVQLIDLAIEKIQHRSVGGVLHDISLMDAFRYLLGTTKDIPLPREAEVLGVDVAPLDDPKVWSDIPVPHNTKISSICDTLTKNFYGMYPVGTEYYYYKNHWFVYPKFNLNGGSQTGKVVTLLNIPRDRFRGVERTYIEDDRSLKILCTGESVFKDARTSNSFNLGIGLRHVSSENIDAGLGSMSNGKYLVNRSDNLSEMVIKKPKNGLNNASFHKDLVTNSLENPIGNIYLGSLTQVALVWENSVEDLIRPGMSGIYIQEDTDGVKKFHCMIVDSTHSISLVGNKVLDEKYSSQSVLVVILGNEIN